MGSFKSKPKSVGTDSKNTVWIRVPGGSTSSIRPIPVNPEPQYETRFLEYLRNQFENEMEKFILDQLALSVMFYENFDQNIKEFSNINTISETEIDLNRSLFKDQKQLIMPDLMFNHVNERVKFKPVHGPKKNKFEPLIPQRIYIIHDNVEILEPEEVDYNRIDKPNVVVFLETSKSNGYGKLKVDYLHSDYPKKSVSSSQSSSSKGSKKNSGLETPTHEIIEEDNAEPQPSTSRQSDEETYIYARINEAKTPQKLEILEKFSPKFPSDWIKAVQVENYRDIDDSDDEDMDENERKRRIDDDEPFITKYYCDSEVFMRHFVNNVFPSNIGGILQFNEESIRNATYISGTIFCNKMDSNDNLNQYEIYPSIEIPWPQKFAYEILIRTRNSKIDSRTNKFYVWPTPTMINAIKTLKCVAIARGFNPKKNKNNEKHLEWELGFPKAERYLQTRMSHSQIKAFLIIVTLFKTFVEPITEKKGLLIEHIREVMLWEIEKNCRDWNLRLLGSRILMLLEALCKYLGRSRLNNFFIKNRNIFENIPGRFLQCAQEKFHIIQEHPVMHFISALRNLSYSPNFNFYPSLDYDKLIKILTTKEGLKLVHPAAYNTVESTRKVMNSKKKHLDKQQDFQWRLMEKKRREREKNNSQSPIQDESKPRLSTDSINYKFQNYNNFDIMKKKELLEFFMDHYIKMANASLKLSTAQNARFYAKQAEYLCKLLNPSLVEIYEKYTDAIRKLQQTCDRRAANEQLDAPPDIPRRNSTGPLTQEVVVHNTTLNLQNLSNIYNSNILAAPSSTSNGVAKGVKLKKTATFKEENRPKKGASFKESVDIID